MDDTSLICDFIKSIEITKFIKYSGIQKLGPGTHVLSYNNDSNIIMVVENGSVILI